MVPDVEDGLSYDAFNLVIDELDIAIGYSGHHRWQRVSYLSYIPSIFH